MSKFLSLTAAAALISLAGCASQIPLPVGHEPATQPKVLAAQHWNGLAADIASRLAAALPDKNVLVLQRPGKGTKFYSAFHDMLETQLMEQGFGVTRQPTAAFYRVEYDLKSAGVADLPASSTTAEVVPADGDILFTVSVLKGSRYVTRISEIFYIDETTHGEYFAAAAPPPGRLVNVVGE